MIKIITRSHSLIAIVSLPHLVRLLDSFVTGGRTSSSGSSHRPGEHQSKYRMVVSKALTYIDGFSHYYIVWCVVGKGKSYQRMVVFCSSSHIRLSTILLLVEL